MGDWDLVRKLMEQEGDVLFWRVMLRPGGPPLFGTWKGTPLFGLPGNPVSSLVVFHTPVSPWISNSLGYHEEMGPRLSQRVSVKLEDSITGAPGSYVSGESEQDQRMVSCWHPPTPIKGVENLHSMVAHNGLTFTTGY